VYIVDVLSGSEGGKFVVEAGTTGGSTGRVVVYNDMVSMVNEPILAGQFVTVLWQEVIV
jgi:hypothetical protein